MANIDEQRTRKEKLDRLRARLRLVHRNENDQQLIDVINVIKGILDFMGDLDDNTRYD